MYDCHRYMGKGCSSPLSEAGVTCGSKEVSAMSITEKGSNPGFLLVQWKNCLFPGNRMRIFRHGPMAWNVMQRNAWKDIANCFEMSVFGSDW